MDKHSKSLIDRPVPHDHQAPLLPAQHERETTSATVFLIGIPASENARAYAGACILSTTRPKHMHTYIYILLVIRLFL